MLTVFVFAKLWRRAEVLTDVELIEMRYAGQPAAFLRGFRGFYVAVVMNSIIIGWVTKAMAGVLKQTVLFDASAVAGAASSHNDFYLVAIMLLVTGAYSVISGMWGVAITDMVQFVLAMVGCTALAVVAVAHVGGTQALQEKVTANFGEGAYHVGNKLVESGHGDVRVRVYPGYRHEVHNEPDIRDDVAHELIAFATRVTAS